MLGKNGLEFLVNISYSIYGYMHMHYNDLLKASKHAPIEVALQRKNMIPSSKAFVKAIYNTDSKTGKIYYLEGKGR